MEVKYLPYLIKLSVEHYNFDDITIEDRKLFYQFAVYKNKFSTYIKLLNLEITLAQFIQLATTKKKKIADVFQPVVDPVEKKLDVPYHMEMKESDVIIEQIKIMVKYRKWLDNFMGTEEFNEMDKNTRTSWECEFVLVKTWILSNIIE